MARRILGASVVLACLCFAAAADETAPKDSPSRRAFFDARKHQTKYAGPGREDPDPSDIDEVRIGYFGPDDPSHPDGGDMWRAAQLAVEEANAQGGYRGIPFRLVPGWSENPWGTGVVQVTRMAYTEKVWAIIGGIDGPSTHLAEQVVAKARLVLLSPASTDKTVNLANVPWMFSCVPGDHLQAPVLAEEILARAGKKPFVLVSADDHDSHLFTVELRKCFAERRMAPRYHFDYRQGTKDVAELVGRIVRSEAGAVVLVAGAGDSARLVGAIRRQGFAGEIFGGPAMGRWAFLTQAGTAAEGALFPLLYLQKRGRESFSSQANLTPSGWNEAKKTPDPFFADFAAAHTYDAVRLLLAAIRKAGLNRARIRDAVAGLSPWDGATGTIRWDSLGSNTRAVRLGTISRGRVISASGPRGLGASTPRCSGP